MECTIRWAGPDTMSFIAETGSGHSFVMDGAPGGRGRTILPQLMEALLSGAHSGTSEEVVRKSPNTGTGLGGWGSQARWVECDSGLPGWLGSRASDTEVRRGMADLGTLVEFGPRLRWNLTQGPGPTHWRVDLPLRGVFDLSNGLAQRGAAFEPELVLSHRDPDGLSYNTGLSMVWGSQGLADTFYGVSAAEATASRPAYTAQSGLIAWRLSGSVSRRVAPGVRLIAFGRVDSVAGAANQSSPLVQQTSGASAGVVLTYTWRQSAERAAD